MSLSTPAIQLSRFKDVPIRVTVGHLAMAGVLVVLILLSGIHSTVVGVLNIYLPVHLSVDGAQWSIVVVSSVVLAVFSGSVLIHELGHALKAVHHGITVEAITLRAGGGTTAFDRDPSTPTAELAVASAGPLASIIPSLVLGVVALLGVVADNQAVTTAATLSSVATITLTVINLVPIFALDGGRVLRAVLARRIGFPRATLGVVYLSYAIAMGLGVIAIVTGYYLLLLVWAFILLTTPGIREVESFHPQYRSASAQNSR